MSETKGTDAAASPQSKTLQQIFAEEYSKVEEEVIKDYVMEIYKITPTYMDFEEFYAWFSPMLQALFVQNNLISRQIRQNAKPV